MARSNLEQAVEAAAQSFALEVIEAVKSATLQELIALQAGGTPKRRGRPPGRKKPGPKPQKKVAAKAPAAKKKRVVKNYPKCKAKGCNKNRFPRGKGYCGDHWRQFVLKEKPGEKVAKQKVAKQKVAKQKAAVKKVVKKK